MSVIRGDKVVFLHSDSNGGVVPPGGQFRGFVNSSTTRFPQARRNDYVKVDKNEENFPFAIQGVTFKEKSDIAVFTGSMWMIYSVTAVTSSVEVADKESESLSGEGDTQQKVNREFKRAIFFKKQQTTASMVWEVEHRMNLFPSVTTVGEDNREIKGEVNYVDVNRLTVSFNQPVKGWVFLS